jgi:uncharacterized protein YjbI with pentapeptide repeats
VSLLLLLVVCLAAVCAIGFVTLAYRREWHWTGFTARHEGPDGAEPRPAKTLWDWMQLLIIPTGLAVALFALNASQAGRDRQREARRIKQDQALAVDRVRADALRVYLAQMSDLMLAHNLRRSAPGSDVRVVARTATLTVLPQLDGRRKGHVLQFLATAGLVRTDDADVLLTNADLRHMKLEPGTELGGSMQLTFANLDGADFSGATMAPAFFDRSLPRGERCQYCYSVDFSNAHLRGAKFVHATLSHATFGVSDLGGSDFSHATIESSLFEDACLSGANFSHAEMTSDAFHGTEGRGVDFSYATLRKVTFAYIGLTMVDLRHIRTSNTVLPKGWRPGTVTAEDPRTAHSSGC